MQLIRNLSRIIVAGPVGAGTSRYHAHRMPNVPIQADAITDTWVRRILELSDGRTVGDIKETMYREEIMAGDWAVGIGIWKQLYCREVVNTIIELAERGYIHVKLAQASEEE